MSRFKIDIISLLFPVFAFSEEDVIARKKIVEALAVNDSRALKRAILDSPVEIVDIINKTVIEAQSREETKNGFNNYRGIVLNALRNEMDDSNYFKYVEAFSNESNEFSARNLVFQSCIAPRKKISKENINHLFLRMEEMIQEKTTSTETRALINRKIGSFSQLKEYAFLIADLDSRDSVLYNSALKGLGDLVIRNRRASQKSSEVDDNKILFEKLKQIKDEKTIGDIVPIIALIRKPYSRDYLFPICKGNAENVATVFFRDGQIDEDRWVVEALDIDKSRDDDLIRNALLFGLQSPQKMTSNFLARDDDMAVYGFRLLRYFPHLIDNYRMHIQKSVPSKNIHLAAAAASLIGLSPNSEAFYQDLIRDMNSDEIVELNMRITQSIVGGR